MSENVFFTKFSELSGERFDAPFFDSKHIENINKIQQVNHTKLSNIVNFSSESWNQKDYFDNKFPYVEISEIDLQTGNINNIKIVPKNEAPSRAKMIVRHNDIIISTTRPTRGAISLIKTNDILIASTGFAVIRTYSDKIKKEYIFNCLKMPIILNQFEQRSSGGNYPAITLEELSKVIIPLPSLEIQNQIISIMDSAYKQKIQKEQEAKEKLASIDKYLLSELGIEFKEKETETLEQRVFTRKFSEVSESRFDAPSNHSKFSFEESKYDLINFRDYIVIDPSLKIKNIDLNTEATFLPMEKISDIYAEALKDETKIFSVSNGYTKFQDGDLLWSKITPCMENGKSAVVENLKNSIGFGSTEYFVFRAKCDNVNIKYIHALLRLKKLRSEAKLFFSGTAGHQRVSKEFFTSLKIPLPSLDIQNKIVAHIQTLRDEAKTLENDAKEVYENAKKEVEAIILQK